MNVSELEPLSLLHPPTPMSSEESHDGSRNDAGGCLNKAPEWAYLLNYACALCDFTPMPTTSGISMTSLNAQPEKAELSKNI